MKDTGLWVLVGLAIVGVGLAGAWGLGAFGTRSAAIAQSAPAAPPAPLPAKGDGTPPPAVAVVQASTSVEPVQVVVAAAQAPTAQTPSDAIVDVTIWDLIQKGSPYAGRTVRVRGTIITQCMSGCEFGLADDSGTLSVQLVGPALEQLVPSGSVGKKAEAIGILSTGDRPQLVVDDPDHWKILK
ncbi:MAG: hypothetical protein NTY63_08330 [Candidatus Bipolaricaulota bacterium]|nr:hypothetical protein [Candidatus Bipolaricaulota bacterium]